MEDLRTRILNYYDLSEEDYARIAREPSFSDIPTMEEDLAALSAKKRILQGIANNEKILIYGDYDTDGIMAASIMMRVFHILGKSASFFIPSRYMDGYGLTMENAEKIAKSGYSLLILVDNGVGCLQEVSYLLTQGVETIIIDHHDLPASLPPALATIHPTLLPYGKVPVSAGYLCFVFSMLLLGHIDEYLLTLGALSTISDCMPMAYHNQKIVALALRSIRKNKYPEIRMLAEREYIDESVLSMNVIPIINAVGRMIEDHKISRVVHYFADMDIVNKSQTADWMKKINMGRKDATKAAMERIQVDKDAAAIVVVGHLLEGLNGLLANRMLNEYEKPVAVFSSAKSDPSLYVGSIRGKEGFNVMEFESSVKHLLVKGGGHAFAGGVSIKKEDFAAFKEAFENFAASHPLVESKKPEIPLLLSEVNMESYRILRSFAPFGHDYEAPSFIIKDLPLSSLRWSADGRFLSTPLSNGVRLFSFSFAKPGLINSDDKVSLSGKLGIDEYHGAQSLTFRAEKV